MSSRAPAASASRPQCRPAIRLLLILLVTTAAHGASAVELPDERLHRGWGGLSGGGAAVAAQQSEGGRARPVAVQRTTGVYALAGDDPALASHRDLEPLGRLIGEASVVGLGETYHTSGGFYRMKHRIFRYLVEELGFRAFAIESLWQGAESAAAYVRTCQGTAQQAIRDHINVWQSSEYADLVQWMCEWNRAHDDPADKLTLFGFDIQQPWYDGPGLITFLGRIGIPTSDPWISGIRSCEAVVDRHPFGQIPPGRHASCVDTLNAIEAHLQSNRDSIIQRTSEDDFRIALLRVVGLRAWENSVYIIAHDFAAGYNARDEGMAYAFHLLREMKATGAKTAVWAANSHVARKLLPDGELPLGSYLASDLGSDYVSLALTAHETEIDFPGFGCGPVERAEGSVEEQLAVHELSALLMSARGREHDGRIMMMGLNRVRPYQDFDGIIYLKHSPKMNPLLWPSCR
jgi:erythromycin esterase